MEKINPQREDGHIDISNEIVDYLCQYRLSGEEWRVLWVILRKTWGWHKKEDWIALSQFAELTKMKKPSIIRTLKKLINKNIISKTANENGNEKSYAFNKHYDTWKLEVSNTANNKKLAKQLTKVSHTANKSLAILLPTKETYTKEKRNTDFELKILEKLQTIKIYPYEEEKDLYLIRNLLETRKINNEELLDTTESFMLYCEGPYKKKKNKNPRATFKNFFKDFTLRKQTKGGFYDVTGNAVQ